jgi:hypothetical protein
MQKDSTLKNMYVERNVQVLIYHRETEKNPRATEKNPRAATSIATILTASTSTKWDKWRMQWWGHGKIRFLVFAINSLRTSEVGKEKLRKKQSTGNQLDWSNLIKDRN